MARASDNKPKPPERRARPNGGTAMPLPDLVVLVLQGGGALGAYQAGVYEALIDHGIELDWVAGISIGAVNAAIIAGNSRDTAVSKMRAFWDQVSDGMPSMPTMTSDTAREWTHLAAAGFVTSFGVPGFFRPRMVPPLLQPAGTPEAISFYDTTPLIETLDNLVDWDRVNNGSVRLSVGAVEIETGNFRYFDTDHDHIDARHILASGALPPGLPPVEIDGVWYWDGGLVSNTPLEHVVGAASDDMLVFQVDLFSSRGPFPQDLEEAWSREKDIRYSSRTRQVSDALVRRRREHKLIARLLDTLTPEQRAAAPTRAVERMLDDHALNVVQLIHRPPPWQTGARDFEFSRATMETNWAMGREAVHASINRGELIAEAIIGGAAASFDLSPVPVVVDAPPVNLRKEPT